MVSQAIEKIEDSNLKVKVAGYSNSHADVLELMNLVTNAFSQSFLSYHVFFSNFVGIQFYLNFLKLDFDFEESLSYHYVKDSHFSD